MTSHGTIGSDPHWILRHKRLLLYILTGILVVLVATVIVCTIMANTAAAQLTQTRKGTTYELSKQIVDFSAQTATIEVKNSTDIQQVLSKLEALQKTVNSATFVSPSVPPLATWYSPSFRNALHDTETASKQLAALRQALDDLVVFARYNQSLASIFESPALSKTVTDEASARALATAWQETITKTTALQPSTTARATQQVLVQKITALVSYVNTVADAYKKTDRTALAAAQPEVDKRVKDIVAAATSLNPIATDLAKKLDQTAAQLQQN